MPVINILEIFNKIIKKVFLVKMLSKNIKSDIYLFKTMCFYFYI
jgi:hypothetical protein